MLDFNLKPSTRQLRQFGFAAAVAFTLLAAVLLWRHLLMGIHFTPVVSSRIATAFGIAAVCCLILAIIAPRVLQPLYVTLMIVAWPIGLVVSYTVMVVLYYGIFTPIGWIFRLIGRDAMQRRLDPKAPTYWISRSRTDDMNRYFRQF